MSIELQKTLAQMVSLKGVGIHTGVYSEITLVPAEPNVGLVFVTEKGVIHHPDAKKMLAVFT